MGDRTASISSRLAERGAETLALFRDLSADQWQAQVYEPGPAWDLRQVLCHFLSAERSFLQLFENVLGGGSGTPEDFDIDRFNAAQVGEMDDFSPKALLDQFEEARAAMVAFVARLTDADLDREGRHPYFGVDKIEKWMKLVYRHNMIHERDIRKALETGQPIPPSE